MDVRLIYEVVSSLCIVAVCTCSVPEMSLKLPVLVHSEYKPTSWMVVQSMASPRPSEIKELAFHGAGVGPWR